MEKYAPFLLLVKITRRNVAGIVQGSFDIIHSIGYCTYAAEQLVEVNWLKSAYEQEITRVSPEVISQHVYSPTPFKAHARHRKIDGSVIDFFICDGDDFNHLLQIFRQLILANNWDSPINETE